jgi:aminoglycoside phosphotransferase (APT) family kinase protein
VLWGDPNPGNFLFADDLSVAAVLDFEAAALGPGEIDLAWWLMMDRRRRLEGSLPGLPDREEMIALYEQALGRPTQNLRYFEVLAAFRMSLVLVRSVARLKTDGRLPAECTAAIANPFCCMLAEFLGVEAPAVGEDFERFRAETRRHAVA